MIVEVEWNTYNGNIDIDYDHVDKEISNIDLSGDTHLDFIAFLQIIHYMHIRRNYQQLQADLVKYIWEHFNHNNDEI